MSKRPSSKGIKTQLFLQCGRVDMYNMQKYAKEDLRLHHDPPYRETKHTVYEESYLLSERTHIDLHRIEHSDPEEYRRRMEIIKQNKKILELRNIKRKN